MKSVARLGAEAMGSRMAKRLLWQVGEENISRVVQVFE